MKSFRSPLLAVLLGILGACNTNSATAPNSGPPFLTGNIASVDSTHRYLVVRPGALPSDSAYFRLDANTTIGLHRESDGRESDLRVGITVNVWSARPTPGSDPPEILARHVQVYPID